MKTNEKQTLGNQGILFKITTTFTGLSEPRDNYCYATTEAEAIEHSQGCNEHYRSRPGFAIISIEALPNIDLLTSGKLSILSTSIGQTERKAVTIAYEVIESHGKKIKKAKKIEKGFFPKINIPYEITTLIEGWQVPQNVYTSFRGNVATIKASTLDKMQEAAYQEAIDTPWK